MNGQNTPAMREACEAMETLVTALAAGYGFWGIRLLMKGYENNDSGLKEEGLRILLNGGGLAAIAPLVQSGIVSKDQFMEYLAAL